MGQFIPQAGTNLALAAEDLLRAMTRSQPSRQQHLSAKLISNLSGSSTSRLPLTTHHPQPLPACSDLLLSWHPPPPPTQSSAAQIAIKSHSSSVYALLSGWEESVCKEINYFAMFLLIQCICSPAQVKHNFYVGHPSWSETTIDRFCFLN